MATTREEVQIRLGVDNSTVAKGLAGTRGMITGWASGIRDTLKDFGRQWGAALTLGGTVAAIKTTLSHFEDLSTRAANLQISTDFLQGIQQISSQQVVGGSKALADALAQLNVNLGQAKAGISEGVDKFKRWNITLEDIQNLDTEQTFLLIADRIKDIPDPAQRAALAFDLLGKSGKGAADLLGKGSAEIQKMVDSVDKLGQAEIENLALIQHNIQDTQNKFQIVIGEIMVGYHRAFRVLRGYLKGGVEGGVGEARKIIQELYDASSKFRKHNVEVINPNDPVEKEKTDAESVNKAWAKFYEDEERRQLRRMDLAHKILALEHKLQFEKARLNKLDADSIEYVKTLSLIRDTEEQLVDLREQQNREAARGFQDRIRDLEKEIEAKNRLNQADAVAEDSGPAAPRRRRWGFRRAMDTSIMPDRDPNNPLWAKEDAWRQHMAENERKLQEHVRRAMGIPEPPQTPEQKLADLKDKLDKLMGLADSDGLRVKPVMGK